MWYTISGFLEDTKMLEESTCYCEVRALTQIIGKSVRGYLALFGDIPMLTPETLVVPHLVFCPGLCRVGGQNRYHAVPLTQKVSVEELRQLGECDEEDSIKMIITRLATGPLLVPVEAVLGVPDGKVVIGLGDRRFEPFTMRDVEHVRHNVTPVAA